MIGARPLTAVLTTGIAAYGLLSCAGSSESGPTILEGMGSSKDGAQTRASGPPFEILDTEGPILLPYRDPGRGGIAYRLTFEVEGQRTANDPADRKAPPIRETETLEADFRKLPVENADSGDDVFLVGLDALRYTQKQQNPPAASDLEIADDRLRIRINDKVSVDNRGNRVTGPFAPRIFLGRIFGVITHDASGNPIQLSSRGAPAARQLMDGSPTLGAIAYAMITLPEEPVSAGTSWSGVRIPPSRAGELGLSLPIEYSLTGFEIFEGVPCALIVMTAHLDEEDVTSVTGHKFDRVQATLNGTVRVELENSLVRRVVLSDQIRASWTESRNSISPTQQRIEHTSKLVMALRDPRENPDRWADGTVRFESH